MSLGLAALKETNMAHIKINGNTIIIEGNGSNVSVRNGQVTVNGKPVGPRMENVMRIEWDGPLANLESDASVTCGDVKGDVRAGGTVQAQDVGGNVQAGGVVQCGDVRGSVSAGGTVMRG